MKGREERRALESAGNVVGADPVPDEEMAVRFGGPLSTLRAEAAGLLQLLICLSENHQQAPLLVFMDTGSLVLILQNITEVGEGKLQP